MSKKDVIVGGNRKKSILVVSKNLKAGFANLLTQKGVQLNNINKYQK